MASVPQSSVPIKRRTKLVFSPVDSANMRFNRQVLFKEMRSFIKTKYPSYVLEYGYLGGELTKKEILESMMGIEVSLKYDQRLMQIDYCLIYKIPKSGKILEDLAMIWCPSRFSSKSLNTMALYKYQGKLNEYLEDFFENNPVIPINVVYSFLEQKEYGLSRKKYLFSRDPRTLERTSSDNPQYWKLPSHANVVVKGIQEVCKEYNPDTKH